MQAYAEENTGFDISEGDQIEYNMWFADTVSKICRTLDERKQGHSTHIHTTLRNNTTTTSTTTTIYSTILL